MRSVLFIAYDFPPAAGIGSGLRSAYFSRYLPEFGWQPSVVALDSGQSQAPGVVRLASPTPWRRPYEVTPYGWAFALHHYLRQCDGAFDLIYVSCPPYPQALAAATFARHRKLPLVVDFRDAWSLDPYQEGSRLKRLLYRHLFPSMERRLVSQADLLILNTPSTLRAYQALYPERAGAMACLPNGYDETAFPVEQPQISGDVLVLLHAGRFGIGARSPANLLSGLALARQRGCQVRLEILGEQPDVVGEQIQTAGLGLVVKLHGQVSYEQSVAAMCAAGALVLVQAPSTSVVQAIAGKTFDYLRAGRPILAIAPLGDNLNLIRRHSGRYEQPIDEPEAIAEAIIRLYEDWRRGALAAQQVDQAVTELYERRALAARLADHFEHVLDREGR